MSTGDGRGSAPARDWVPQALSPIFPQWSPEIMESVRSSVYAACGVPYTLFNSGAASTREAYRVFLTSCLTPLSLVIKAELDTKLESSITFDFSPLLSTDITAKARAVKGLRDAGMELNDALQIAGLNTGQ